VLPRHARLTSPNDFARTTKSGIRLTSKSLVLYFYATNNEEPARFGLIVGKSVGGSVVRHRVARRLRHSLREHMVAFPSGSLVVVRALSNSANLLSTNLSEELEASTQKLLERSAISR